MAITARDIHEKEFSHGFRGYKEDEVDDFLDLCAAEVDRLTRENTALYAQLDQAKHSLTDSGIPAPAVPEIVEVEAYHAPASHASSAEIGDILVLAQNTADDLLAKAHSQAEKIVNAAEGRASEIVGEAAARKREILEVAKVLKQAEVDFRTEYRGLLEKSLATITEIRMDIDPEAEVSIVAARDPYDDMRDHPAVFDDEIVSDEIDEPEEEPALDGPNEPEPVAVEEPKPFDPGILESTSFIEQVELDDDFEIEEID